MKRHLSRRELVTIAMCLESLAQSPKQETYEDVMLGELDRDEWLSDDELLALALELRRARKVKVCRTKRHES
ncbi:MAG TPA: hypothetical protein VJN96_15235 [Vicinamibacterales bacterium]|nr:hypothetical protein [Vicinamibacterales bacterium]